MSEDSPHLEPTEVAAFIDDSLDDAGRARIIAHLADCAGCRNEIAEVRAALKAPGRRVSWWWLGTAAAAVLAGVVLLGPLLESRASGPTFRGDDTSAGIEVITPAGPVSAGQAPTFVWRSVGQDAIYTLVLLDETATVLWRVDATRDTSVTAPADVRLVAGASYLYTLDARLPDGRVITTGTRQLDTR